jgi:hypothetical protein
MAAESSPGPSFSESADRAISCGRSGAKGLINALKALFNALKALINALKALFDSLKAGSPALV